MIKKEECEVFYDENLKEIYLTDDSCDDEEEIKGEVFFNHDKKEIRIFNLNKKELSDLEKTKIMFEIIKKEYLFPYSFKSLEIAKGNIAEYTLLINGYLLDGTFKEYDQKYKSIVEELIDEFKDGDEEVENITTKIKHFYRKYAEEIGKEEVDIYLTGNGVINSFIEYINFSKLFAAYAKSKGKRFRLLTSNKFWKKEKKIIILPY